MNQDGIMGKEDAHETAGFQVSVTAFTPALIDIDSTLCPVMAIRNIEGRHICKGHGDRFDQIGIGDRIDPVHRTRLRPRLCNRLSGCL